MNLLILEGFLVTFVASIALIILNLSVLRRQQKLEDKIDRLLKKEEDK